VKKQSHDSTTQHSILNVSGMAQKDCSAKLSRTSIYLNSFFAGLRG